MPKGESDSGLHIGDYYAETQVFFFNPYLSALYTLHSAL